MILPFRGLAASFLLPILTMACAVPVQGRSSDDAVIYVIEREWHTDIGLPADAITGPLVRLEDRFPGVRFLTFGFGERRFVVERRKDFGSMLNALLPSQSALLVTALKETPRTAFGAANVVALHMSRDARNRIVDGISHELELAGSGEPVLLAEGPYPGSVFYAARQTYYGLFTCNTWTAETLRAGGLPVPTAGVLFSGQVMGMARWIAARQPSSEAKE